MKSTPYIYGETDNNYSTGRFNMTDIIDETDKIAFYGGLGNDLVWGELSTEEQRAEFNASYELVTNGADDWFHTDGDLYQGSTLMRVIRRKSDSRLFGFEYWQGGGKYGETYIEPNGYDYGLESDGEEKDWYVFLPVKYTPLPAYRLAKA